MIETTEILGNLGEFIGAVAVVITLFYLAYQVRQGREALDANTLALNESRRMVGAQSFQQRTQMIQSVLLASGDSVHFAPIAAKLEAGGWEALSKEEQWRYEKLQIAVLSGVENLHYQYQQGYIDQERWDATLRQIGPFVSFWKFLGIFEGRNSFLTEVERAQRG